MSRPKVILGFLEDDLLPWLTTCDKCPWACGFKDRTDALHKAAEHIREHAENGDGAMDFEEISTVPTFWRGHWPPHRDRPIA
jgi:hypothetical protein